MIARLLFIFTMLVSTSYLLGCSDSTTQLKSKKNSSRIKANNKVTDSVNAELAWGGLMYDRWWISAPDGTMPAPPANLPTDDTGAVATNASWPATNTKKTDITTWRCKSCHGWDYVGADGMYSDTGSSYYTGIYGITNSANYSPQTSGDPDAVYTAISTGALPNGDVIPDHDFGTYLTDTNALTALTAFVIKMQAEAADGKTPQSQILQIADADQANGYHHYMLPTPQSEGTTPEQQGGCGDGCHGEDGMAINIHPTETKDPHNVAEFASNDPFEVLHKIRFGHPTAVGSPNLKMPGLEWYDNPEILEDSAQKVAIDVLAFAQNGLLADHARGGRLYDNWVLETGGEAPSDPQPLLHLRSTDPALPPIAPEQAWLCSSCHGYDYEGSGFANNLVELKGVRSWTIDYLYSYLKKGRYAYIDNMFPHTHHFGHFINDADLWNLAEFLMEGVTDTHSYLSLGLNGSALGKIASGNKFYMGNMADVMSTPGDANATLGWACNTCHGDDGKSGDVGIDIRQASWEAPWRFLHRVRFGMPGVYSNPAGTMTRMPGLLELVLTDPMDTSMPMPENKLLLELTHRTTDVQTYVQDLLIQNGPASALSSANAATHKILKAEGKIP